MGMISIDDITRSAVERKANPAPTSPTLTMALRGGMAADGDFQSALDKVMGGLGLEEEQNNALPVLDRQIVKHLSQLVRSNIKRAESLWQGSAFTYANTNTVSRSALKQADATGNSRILETERSSSLNNPYEGIIDKAAKTYDIDANLIRSVIEVESGFDSQAVSRVGAQGLMQLMPATAAELGVTDSFDPEQNIMAGSNYLKQLMDRYQGDRSLTLAAYNWGMGNLERKPDAMPLETRNYIGKVNTLMEEASATA
ncbi:MAG: lytic transglycosylase domain-containing protein [Magnetococcales bacterium]|nr:lytic transglycosylase domain-containing protein [Magnetococcales bacterium]